MFRDLPNTTAELITWSWGDIAPYYSDLAERPLSASNLPDWLADWSRVSERVDELYNRLQVATAVNTADTQADQLYDQFLDTTFPAAQQAEFVLMKKLLLSGLQPEGMQVPMRNMRADVALFREANLPLLSQEAKLSTEYNKIVGAQTIDWNGKEITLSQLYTENMNPDRTVRESAWRLMAERWQADRQAINDLWRRFLALRIQIAANAGFDNYTSYRWQYLHRFDYTPEDTRRFHQAIEEMAVPAVQRILEQRRKLLGVDRLRPWDLDVDPLGRPALHPFDDIATLVSKTSTIFHHVDPQLGEYFDRMVQAGLLDLENRKNKAPGAFCASFAAVRKPFIFANAVGLQNDVDTLLHEGGHAMHDFESAHLPYFIQRNPPPEFAEVASMSMELLGSPYLAEKVGGFYNETDTARARAEHLDGMLAFWPYMAVVDAFQHWVYAHPQQAMDSAACDLEWGRLWDIYQPGVDWSGLEETRISGWHRKLHIHTVPFYYVEYGLAQLGAAQIFRNSMRDPAGAVAAYRNGLSLGDTFPLPALYEAAGVKLAFDSQTLGESVLLLESTLTKLQT